MQKLLNSTGLVPRFGYSHLSTADAMAQASGSLHHQSPNCVLTPYSSSGNLCLFLGVWALKPSLPFILPSNHWSLKLSPANSHYSILFLQEATSVQTTHSTWTQPINMKKQHKSYCHRHFSSLQQNQYIMAECQINSKLTNWQQKGKHQEPSKPASALCAFSSVSVMDFCLKSNSCFSNLRETSTSDVPCIVGLYASCRKQNKSHSDAA